MFLRVRLLSLLGPNGAGKTTTVNVLTTLIKADGGTVRVAGHDIATEARAVRAVIGVTGRRGGRRSARGEENLQLDANCTISVREGERPWSPRYSNTSICKSAPNGVDLCQRTAEKLEAWRSRWSPARQIIFLDEPTAGLDPRSRRTMWNIVRELMADGVTVFLTTQYLEEADQLRRPDRGTRPGPPGRRGHSRRTQAPGTRQPRPAPVSRRDGVGRGGASPGRLHRG